jgi:dihydropyrimidine dehydrogenase (NAD+) subunit PreA
MDLSVSFMGLKLKNPIIVAAGPLTGSGEMLKKAVQAGAGAVVTKTIVNEIRSNVRPRLFACDNSMQNIELYSEFTLEEWEQEISYSKKFGAVVIANIMAHTPSEMAYIAKRVEKYGADAIELGISIPHGEKLEILVSDPNRLYEFVKSVVDTINIPVMVKLSSNVTNISRLARAAEKAGASAISGIDSVRAIIGVDIEKGKTLLPTYGGYSGLAIRPIGLAAVAAVSQAVNIPVCGIGGISNYKHVIEYIMLGASTVQLCTSLILNGLDEISTILVNLEDWLKEREYESLNDIKGKALQSLRSFEEIRTLPYVSFRVGSCHSYECELCRKSCIYGAIIKNNNKIIINPDLCTGCGLCTSLCLEKNLELRWR